MRCYHINICNFWNLHKIGLDLSHLLLLKGHPHCDLGSEAAPLRAYKNSKLPQFSHTLFFFSLLLEYGSGLVTKSHLTLTIPWTIACQAPLFIGFSRQEYWNSLRFLLQRIFPTQGSILGLLHCRQILYQMSHRVSLNLQCCVSFRCK